MRQELRTQCSHVTHVTSDTPGVCNIMSAVPLGAAIHIHMRTLLDLLNNERGYVRIYTEQESFGYELSTYVQRPMADLFERMNGYASIAAAREAARYQLSAATQVRRRGRKRS